MNISLLLFPPGLPYGAFWDTAGLPDLFAPHEVQNVSESRSGAPQFVQKWDESLSMPPYRDVDI
jgi:hypothetical protein